MHLGHYCELSEAVCQIALRSCSQRGERETRICRNFGWGKKKKKTSIEYQKIITNHKEKTSQVKDFSVFLCMKVKVKSLSHVRLFATPWTV